ncbi:hypothetical protein CSUB01_09730 [Colletotrichum sublineola]|uniref:Uncharacterized protein n=1 Tax=Colletotrichum sublineola TaxID=1173701 RepID=A0A066Y1S7_COLSU|nr:hypothetical protein CSUB01_09730 [Colletotrichum sublineola]
MYSSLAKGLGLSNAPYRCSVDVLPAGAHQCSDCRTSCGDFDRRLTEPWGERTGQGCFRPDCQRSFPDRSPRLGLWSSAPHPWSNFQAAIVRRLFPTGERRVDGTVLVNKEAKSLLALYPFCVLPSHVGRNSAENSVISKTPPPSTPDPPECHTDPSIVPNLTTTPFSQRAFKAHACYPDCTDRRRTGQINSGLGQPPES